MSFFQKVIQTTTTLLGFSAALSGLTPAQGALSPLTFYPKRNELSDPKCVFVGPNSIPTQESDISTGSYALILNEALTLGSYGPHATTFLPETAGKEPNKKIQTLEVLHDDEGHALVSITSISPESDEEIAEELYTVMGETGYILENSNIIETGNKTVGFCFDNVAFNFGYKTTEKLKELITPLLSPEAAIEELEEFEDHPNTNCFRP